MLKVENYIFGVKMKIILVLVAMASCLAMSIDAAQFRFDNYQVYKIKVESEAQLLALQEIENSASFEGGFDFWKSPVLGDEAELMVPPFEVPRFSAMINSLGIKSQLKIKDVQKLVSITLLKIITCIFYVFSKFCYPYP